tara:strand:- start:966 stop:1199 length:234 start_codon:yes stop_codon:yes gene_type:complete
MIIPIIIEELNNPIYTKDIDDDVNTDRICGKLDVVSNKLEDKKEVVKNTHYKGVLIVQLLDETDYDIPENLFLVYIH